MSQTATQDHVLPATSPLKFMKQALREEAAVEPDKVVTTAVTKETQIIAIYGKGALAKASRWPICRT